MATLSKYVFESALVLGAFILALGLFAAQSVESAVGTLVLITAAATRVMPSLLRLQQAGLTIRHASGLIGPTLGLARDLSADSGMSVLVSTARFGNREAAGADAEFQPALRVENVTFRYPGAAIPALQSVSFAAASGTSIALAGSSGAGKSTLADILLGVLEPDEGSVKIGGESPRSAQVKWPGSMAYVPQEAFIANTTIRRNIALGIDDAWIDDEAIWHALDLASLAEFVQSLPDGIETDLGERGVRFSGGQRQRLGIARALYDHPRLMILDEATSALDAETETAIGRTLQQLEGEVTTVVIAHRLSTVRHVGLLLYLDAGRLVGQGTFEEVRNAVPALDRQSRLMGL